MSSYSDLDAVYLEIVSHFLVSSIPKTVRPYYTEVVGSMVFLRDLLTVRAIAELTALDPDDVITTLRPLQSVLTQTRDFDSSVSFYHASFSDFVTSDRCLEPALRFLPEERDAYLAKLCLTLMTKKLKENMANIQDPMADMSTMPGLADRIEPGIAYAARFWGSHLRGSTRIENREGLTAALKDFIGFPLVYWVEVCGILGNVGPAVQCLLDALQWMVCDPRSDGILLTVDR